MAKDMNVFTDTDRYETANEMDMTEREYALTLVAEGSSQDADRFQTVKAYGFEILNSGAVRFWCPGTEGEVLVEAYAPGAWISVIEQ